MALATTQVNRLAGLDRIDTALKIWDSQTTWSNTIILARADAYPDALGAAPLAKLLKAPIVLTQPGSLPASVKTKLDAKQVKKVIILGGTNAVNTTVETEITSLGITVERIAGANRYETSARIAQQTIALSGGKTLPLLVATGKNFPDALTAGAAAAHAGAGFLLADTPLSAETLQLIRFAPSVTAIGGPAVQTLVREGIKHTPVYGKDRFDTATQIADRFFPTPKGAYVATGANFPDALAASAAAGMEDTPILLTTPHELSATTKTWLTAHKGLLSKTVIIGGTSAVSPKTETQIKAALTGGNSDNGAGGAGGAGGAVEAPSEGTTKIENPTEKNIIRTKEQATAAIKEFKPSSPNEDIMLARNTMKVDPKELPEKTTTAGGIISVLPNDQYPNGLLQKVIKVEKNSDGTETLTTRQATLPEAIGETNGPVVLPVYDPEKVNMSEVSLDPIPLQKYAKSQGITVGETPVVTTDRASGITKTEVRTGWLPQSCRELKGALDKKVKAKGNSIAPRLYEKPVKEDKQSVSAEITLEKEKKKKTSKYTASVSAKGKATVNLTGSLGIVAGACIDIEHLQLKEMEIGFGSLWKHSATVTVSGEINGKVKKPLFNPPSKVVMIWAIPVTIDTELDLFASVQASAELSKTWSWYYKHVYGITYHDGRVEALNYEEASSAEDKNPFKINAKVQAGLELSLKAKLLGLAGPEGTAALTATAFAKDIPSENQECKASLGIDASINGKVGVNLPKLTGIWFLPNYEDTLKIYKQEWKLLETPNLCPASEIPADSGLHKCRARTKDKWWDDFDEVAQNKADLAKITELDCGIKDISNVEGIGKLTNLQKADLNTNPLKSLPAEIKNLTKLKKLDAHNAGLEKLPPEIGQLKALENLHLGFEFAHYPNRLTTLPKEIGNLSNLKKLNLTSNQLVSLPDTIGKLSKLEFIDLGKAEFTLQYNQLHSLPASITNLTNLKALGLGGNKITALPSDIGRLSKLEILDIRDNPIYSLPTGEQGIGALSNLTSLEIRLPKVHLCHAGCKSIDLPADIGKLSKLKKLTISGKLSQLPDITNLQSLKALDLSYNNFTQLPAQISALKSLKTLDIDGNKFRDVEFWGLPSDCRVTGGMNCNAKNARCKSKKTF